MQILCYVTLKLKSSNLLIGLIARILIVLMMENPLKIQNTLKLVIEEDALRLKVVD